MSRELRATGIDRRTVLKASLLAGGGFALDALIPFPVSAFEAAGSTGARPRLPSIRCRATTHARTQAPPKLSAISTSQL